MAIVPYRFVKTNTHLFTNNFLQTPVAAQLVSNAYVYDATHATRGDIGSTFVGNPIALTGRTITTDASNNTVLDCDNISFAEQGVLRARYLLIHFWLGVGAGQASDKLIMIVDLDTTAVEQEITPALQVSLGGLYRIPFQTTATQVQGDFGFFGADNSCGFGSINDL